MLPVAESDRLGSKMIMNVSWASQPIRRSNYEMPLDSAQISCTFRCVVFPQTSFRQRDDERIKGSCNISLFSLGVSNNITKFKAL